MPLLGDIDGERLTSQVLMDRFVGTEIYDIDHLRQSIVDILTTPLGSRVMRREYGSRLFQLIDAPMSSALVLEIISAVVDALHRWEPRLRITKVEVVGIYWSTGQIVISLEGYYLLQGEPLRLQELSLDFFKLSRYSLIEQS